MCLQTLELQTQISSQNAPTGAINAIVMPRIGSYADMQKFTGRSYTTVARWVCRKKLKPGVYIGNGMFNMSRIVDYLEKQGTFLREAK